MADEIFRNMDDFVSSDIIYSMREQMTPSDVVVSSLLARIAADETSPESFENMLPFETASKVSQMPAKKRASGRNSILKYGTAAVAGFLILVSTVTIFGNGNSQNVKNLIDNVLPDNVITTPPQDDPAVTVPDDKDSDKTADGKDSDKTTTDKNDSADGKKQTADSKDSNNPGKTDNKAQTPSGADRKNNGHTAPAPDDNTVSIGKNTTGDVSFNREILAEESVSHIAISGSNYVVDTSSTSTTTTSEIKSVSLTIPETSTTNEATVTAQVKKLQNVSTNFMVAVDVDGFKETLLYTNESYKPETLGQFISDSGLDSSVTYSKAVYCKGENIGYSSYHRFTVNDLRELVDNYAFADESAVLSGHSAYSNANVHVLFKSTSNPTGSAIDFGVSDNGYLYVKMSAGKAFTFHIGSDNAQTFISSITGK